MKFTNWLVLNENIADNFNNWLASIIEYAKPRDLIAMDYAGFFGGNTGFLSAAGNRTKSKTQNLKEKILKAFDGSLKRYKEIIIKVLSRKKLENINWLSFSLGFLIVKVFAEEDLDLAIDVTRDRISGGELPKSEIGSKGWFKIGMEADKFVKEHILKQQELSNRQKKKMQKQGDILDKDKSLIRFVAKEDNYKLILMPSLNIHPDSIEQNKDKVESRKRLLCKYGKGTTWCTANPTGSYDQYYLNNDIYVFFEGENPKYQFVGCKSTGRAGSSGAQFMDTNDEDVAEIKYKEKEFLKKYVNDEIDCYNFNLIFEKIKEYQDSSDSDKNKMSLSSCFMLLSDEQFKGLKEYEKKKIISKSGSFIWDKRISEKLTQKDYELVDNSQLVNATRISMHSPWVKGILQKISRKKFEDMINNSEDSTFSIRRDLTTSQIRKINIRKILNFQIKHGKEALNHLFEVVNLLTSKIEVGPPEAYTIFDFVIGEIHSSSPLKNFEKNKLSLEVQKNLDKFAIAMGQDAINKIDLERLQERLSYTVPTIKFEKIGSKYKVQSNQSMFGEIIIYFLKKYSEKIISE